MHNNTTRTSQCEVVFARFLSPTSEACADPICGTEVPPRLKPTLHDSRCEVILARALTARRKKQKAELMFWKYLAPFVSSYPST